MSASINRPFVLRTDNDARSLYSFLQLNREPMAKNGRPLVVTVAEYKAKRSVEQNKKLWALLNDIAASAWVGGKQFSADMWHEYFKGAFIGYEETPDGRKIGISTTTLSVEEFANYIQRIEVYAVDTLGIQLL